MEANVPGKLLIALACCLLVASRLAAQGSGSAPGTPWSSGAPPIGDNRAWGLDQPRLAPKNFTPGVRSPAEERDLIIRGGKMPSLEVGSYPQTPPLPAPVIPFPPENIAPLPTIQTGAVDAIFSIIAPVAILIVTIMSGVARRPAEESFLATRGPSHRGQPFVKLGADGKGGIMYLGDR